MVVAEVLTAIASVIAAVASGAALRITKTLGKDQNEHESQLAKEKWVRDNLTSDYTQISRDISTFLSTAKYRTKDPDFEPVHNIADLMDSFIAKAPKSLAQTLRGVRASTIVLDLAFIMRHTDQPGDSESQRRISEAIERLEASLRDFRDSFRSDAGLD